jgi:LCP family protein required for cell wall assembly
MKIKKNQNFTKIVVFVLVLILLPILTLGYLIGFSNLNIFNPVKIASSFSDPKVDSTDGRVNILILGIDQRKSGNAITSTLTDTLLVASVSLKDGNATLISLPRDLWVESKIGISGKINSVYAQYDNKNQKILGSEGTKDVIEGVLGIPIHYYLTVNFEMFKKVIDTLGGIEVEVESTFTDTAYPIEGMENAPNISDRYETVIFNKGIEIMDGERALKYVRSRHGDAGEGTDFARSARQQKVIVAIKNKLTQTSTLIDLPKIRELFQIYEKEVDTNISLDDLANFYSIYQKTDLSNFKKIVLDDRSSAETGGLLYAPEDTTPYYGAYVLIPRTGDYTQIHAYVKKYLFE